MSVPYHRPVSSELTRDEDHFLKGMPQSILPPASSPQQRGFNDGQTSQEKRGDSNLSDEQRSELKRCRDAIKSMGRELSNLQATVDKLTTENQALRKSSATSENVMSMVMTDPNVEVDTPDEFVERYVSLKMMLEDNLAEFKKYKDRVQKLQNQLIKAHDREKKFLNFEVDRGIGETTKPEDKEKQRMRNLQNTVTQQESVIRNLEKALRDYLDRTERRPSAKSSISSASSKTGLSVKIRDPQENEIIKLMDENARLRDEIVELRLSIQQDDLKNLQLNEEFAFCGQRIESLEAQLSQNAQRWKCEKRELSVRLQEQESSLAHDGGIDVGSRYAF